MRITDFACINLPLFHCLIIFCLCVVFRTTFFEMILFINELLLLPGSLGEDFDNVRLLLLLFTKFVFLFLIEVDCWESRNSDEGLLNKPGGGLSALTDVRNSFFTIIS